jgi:hypothetical protein
MKETMMILRTVAPSYTDKCQLPINLDKKQGLVSFILDPYCTVL